MRETNATASTRHDTSDDHNGGSLNRSRSDKRRSRRAEEKAPSAILANGPHSAFDIRQVERMREAIISADERRSWRDFLLIAGAILLAICVVSTLVIASAVNARANRIIANDAARARAIDSTINRLEGKLDSQLEQHDINGGKLDTLLEQHATTTTLPAPPRRTTTTTRRPTATTRPAPPTTRPAPPTVPPTTRAPAPIPPPVTVPPCRFALLDMCLFP